MRVFVTGTRGIPDIPGGIEKHCQELYPRISARGHEVYLCTRKPYVIRRTDLWRNVKLVHCFAPRSKHFEAIIHTLIALFKAPLYSPDIVHIHAIGPAILVPLARLMGLKVVLTTQGPDYNRKKWGGLARSVLRLGEKIGGICAHEVIVVSSLIGDTIRKRCHRDCHLVYNGVNIPQPTKGFEFLTRIGAEPGKYVLAVARFVPEKGLHDLIDAFKEIDTDFRLVIAGEADHESDYSRLLRRKARDDARIILTGYITGEALKQVYGHARLFVLPSYHEGLPLALLEAMSHALPVLVSDIPANQEVELPAERYFPSGDVRELRRKIEFFMNAEMSEEERQDLGARVREKYNWDRIADQTIRVYRRAIGSM
jgi:starch synthase